MSAITLNPSAAAFARPDYAGRGIANLMVTLEHALGHAGAREDMPPCTALPEAELREARHVVLLVVDGMGALQLRTHAPDGALANARIADLTSVFPSTTASAVSTYLTGDAPLAHGLTGWHMWFRELGVVAAPLPFKTRGTHVPMQDMGVDAAAPVAHPTLRRPVDEALRDAAPGKPLWHPLHRGP